MNLPEIINVPLIPTSRDIRNLLPFSRSRVQDATGQVHVAGSETWATLDMLDGFDIRSPVSGVLAMRVKCDGGSHRSSEELTRYPWVWQKHRRRADVLDHTDGRQDSVSMPPTSFPLFHDINGIRLTKLFPGSPFPGRWRAPSLVLRTGWRQSSTTSISGLPSGADTIT